MNRRFLALILSFTLLAGIVPTLVYAEDAAEAVSTPAEQPANTPQEKPAEEVQPEAELSLYERLMAAETLEAAEKILAGISPENREIFAASLSEAEQDALQAHMNSLTPQEVSTAGAPAYVPAAKNAAVLAATSGVDADGLITEKTATPNDDGSYTVSMSAYVTGEVTSTTTTTTTPCDIVLVLDLSGSMSGELKDLKKTVKNFINSVANQNAGHRISIVKFAGPFNDNKYAEGNHKTYRARGAGWENDTQIRIGWRNAATQKNDLTSAVDSLDIYVVTGRTYSSYGLELANYLLGSANPGSNKVIVLFTDGNPSYDWDTKFHSNAANDAISQANTAKKNGVKVFCVGMYDGANPNDTSKDTNRYLNYTSSNYPNATGWNSPGSGSNKGFFMGSSGTGGLDGMFERISNTITTMKPAINLTSATVLRDVVTKYFTPPANASAIHVYTQDCTGGTAANPTFGERKEITGSVQVGVSGDTVTVSGFDYAANAVTGSSGKKLIVEFTVKPKDGFLGGKGVPTNVDTSGIYNGSTCVENFPVPTVDVEVALVGFIYRTREYAYPGSVLTLEEMLRDQTPFFFFSSGGKEFYLNQLEDWQMDFITVNLVEPTATSLDTTVETSYRVTYEVRHKADNSLISSVGTTVNIVIVKLRLTFRDSTVKAGSTVNSDTFTQNNLGNLWRVWCEANQNQDGISLEPLHPSAILGTEPELTLSYSPASQTLGADDLPVNVTVETDNPHITASDVYFAWEEGDCTHEAVPVHASDADSHEFTVHVDRSSANYTIRYWRDAANTGTLLGSTQADGTVGTQIQIASGTQEGQLDWKRPEGYQGGAQAADAVITSDGNAVVDVVYTPVVSALRVTMHVGGRYANLDLPFTGTASYTGYSAEQSGTLPYSLANGQSAVAEDLAACKSFSLTLQQTLPAGYVLEKVVINGTTYSAQTWPQELPMLEGENTIDIYYLRQEVPVTGISTGSLSAALLLGCTALVGMTILLVLRRRRRSC